MVQHTASCLWYARTGEHYIEPGWDGFKL